MGEGKVLSSFEIYRCKDSLRRFSEKNLAFKKISEELGVPWFEVFLKNLFSQVKESKIGKGVEVEDGLEARAHIAMWMGASTWNRLTSPYGEGHENQGFLTWKPINIPEIFTKNRVPDPDPERLTKFIKQIARFLGASDVGIAEINRVWVFEETCRNIYDPDEPKTKKIVFKDVESPEETEDELIIPESVRFAVVLIFDSNSTMLRVGSASVDTSAATNMGYSRMGITEIALAEAIRTMGYNAIPCKNGTALSVPLAIDAGLGQLGRNGLLITPKYGANVRIGKVLTDLPLVPDRPIDFGVTEFCEKCGRCAEICEAKAISGRERTYEPPVETGNPGAFKWYIDGKACLRYWIESGASCSACQAVCPFNMVKYEHVSPKSIWDMEMLPFGIDTKKL